MTYTEAVTAAKDIYRKSPSAIREALQDLPDAFRRDGSWPEDVWLRHMLGAEFNASDSKSIAVVKSNSVILQLGILIGIKMREI